MVKKKKENLNVDDVEDLEKPVDLDLMRTSMVFPREQMRQLKIAAAERGTSMADIVRGLLENHFDVDDDEIRENVEDYFPEILGNCGGWFGGFKISKFIEQMTDKEIEFSHLNAIEWRSVLVKLEDSGLNGVDNASDYRNLFSDLNPNRKQQKDLRKLGRNLIKKEKDGVY